MPTPRPSIPALRARPRGAAVLRVLAVLTAVSFIAVAGASVSIGRAPAAPRGIDPALLTRIDPSGVRDLVRDIPAGSASPVSLEVMPDFMPDPRSFGPRPAPDLDQPLGVVVKPTPTPRPRPQPQVASAGGGGGGGGHRVRGTASWYCRPGVSACHYAHSRGMYAAAGPALRVGKWRGRTVRVCGGGNCVRVTLIDWCGCYGKRVIDLYSDAFRKLGSLSSGTLRVTVSW